MKPPSDMNIAQTYRGAVVPMVTPVTASGGLDEPSLDKLIDWLVAGGVEGVFILGTTGEGVSVPRGIRRRMVERTVARARGKSMVYAGVGDTVLADSVAAANDYFDAGADAVVAQPPVYYPLQPNELLGWFKGLLDQARGPVVLYNIPSTTRISIPLDLIDQLIGHPKFVAIKDSENDPKRLEETMRRWGGRADFSIFVGVGALMPQGMKLGANGIVPSAGNLVPAACHGLCEAAARGDWAAAETHSRRMNAAAAIYQTGRTLGQSLAALKAALHCHGLCGPEMLPPLRALNPAEIEVIGRQVNEGHFFE
jgi:2-dehydro-3-deoxy-D-pentonate aldolase